MGKVILIEYRKANSFHRATFIPLPGSEWDSKAHAAPRGSGDRRGWSRIQRRGQGPGSDLWWEELVTRGFPVEMRNTGTCRDESLPPTAGEEERGCPSWGDSPSFTDCVRNETRRPGSPAQNGVSGIWFQTRLLWDHRWALRLISFQWPESQVTMQNLVGTRKILLEKRSTSTRPPTIRQGWYWSVLVEETAKSLHMWEIKQHWLYTGTYCSGCNTYICGHMCLSWGQFYNSENTTENKTLCSCSCHHCHSRFAVPNWVFRPGTWCLWQKASWEICS